MPQPVSLRLKRLLLESQGHYCLAKPLNRDCSVYPNGRGNGVFTKIPRQKLLAPLEVTVNFQHAPAHVFRNFFIFQHTMRNYEVIDTILETYPKHCKSSTSLYKT